MNYLLNLKILTVTLFRGSKTAILTLQILRKNPPAVLKYYTGSRLRHAHLRGFFLIPMRGGKRTKSANDIEGSLYRNYDAVSGTILRNSKGFHRSKHNLSFYFSLRQAV
jgi:hypothetical protein